MLGDEENQKKLAEAISKLPDTLDSMNRTFTATDETLRKFTERRKTDGQTPIERMVDTIEMTERTLRKFSESSDPGKPPPADQIAKAMENIGEITSLMRTIMARIEQGEGSLGALLNDRQLYDRLNRAARNIEQVSRELQADRRRRPGVHRQDRPPPRRDRPRRREAGRGDQVGPPAGRDLMLPARQDAGHCHHPLEQESRPAGGTYQAILL